MKVCFFAKAPTREVLLDVPYYRTDLQLLAELGHTVETAVKFSQITTTSDLYYTWWYGSGARSLLVAKARRRPNIMVGPIGFSPDSNHGFIARPLYQKTLIRFGVQMADAVVGVSQCDLRGFSALGARSSYVAQPGINLPAVVAARSERQPVILSVGHVEMERHARKRFDCLIRALPLIRGVVPEARLVIAGSPGEHCEELVKLARGLGVGDCVHLPGRISLEERDRYYDTAMVLAQPVRWEALGLVQAEAMAHGLPIVTSPSEVVMEYAGNGALYCDPNDPLALADRIVSLFQDEALWNHCSAANRKRAATLSYERRKTAIKEIIARTVTSYYA